MIIMSLLIKIVLLKDYTIIDLFKLSRERNNVTSFIL